MNAPTAYQHHPGAPEPRVPRTFDGIADALTEPRRMAFFRQIGTADLDQVQDILKIWWCEAMLDTDPNADRIHHAALNGTLPTVSLADIIDRRRALGLPG